jgi:hypothetical protein
MSEDTQATPSAFRKDLSRLAREVEDLSASLKAESRLAREEAIGAELLASRDLVGQLGNLLEAAEQLGDLYVQQLRYWVDDHAATLSALVAGGSADSGRCVIGQHFERRMAHVTEGLAISARVLARQSTASSHTLFHLWKPFLDVMSRDWSGQRKRPGH